MGERGRWPGLLEQNHVLCDEALGWYCRINNHPSGTLCIPPSLLSTCLFVRYYDAQTFGTCSWYSIFFFSLSLGRIQQEWFQDMGLPESS